jgi:hypothetical protein
VEGKKGKLSGESPLSLLLQSQPQQQPLVALDPTREESLRSQYVAPEPKIKLLTRPKLNNTQRNKQGDSGSKSKSKSQPKTLEQVIII